MKKGTTVTANDRLSAPIVMCASMTDATIKNSSSPTKMLKNKPAASVRGRESSSMMLIGSSHANGATRCLACVFGNNTHVASQTVSASGTVVLRSGGGGP